MIIRLAWRSIWRNRRRTIITVCSIAFGLSLAIFFISLGEGMYAQMIEQVVRMQAGHVTLEHPDYRKAPAVDLFIRHSTALKARIEAMPSVDRVKRIILGNGIARSGAGAVAASLMGVEPSVETQRSPIATHLIQGTYLADQDRRGVVVGSELAKHLNLGVGKKMVLTTNDTQGNLVEELFRVKGIFKTGSNELDAYVIQTPLESARHLFGIPADGTTQMGIILKNAELQSTLLRQLKDRFVQQPIAVLPWQDVLPELASYIKMDRGSNWIFQGILIFLILFTIFNTILMSVLERQQEFAMLLALGTEPRQLRLQIFMETGFLGMIGCGLGLLIGTLAAILVNAWGLDLRGLLGESITISGFAISTILYTQLTPAMVLNLTGIVFAATLLLSIFPMQRVTNLSMVELLR